MALHPATKTFLSFLQSHPEIRSQIRAAPGRTLLYAGSFGGNPVWSGRTTFKPMWKEIAEYKRAHPEVADKQILPDVLARVTAPGTRYSSLLAYVQDLEHQVPERDAFTVWRALSGIFASNASGPVSFQIGSGITVDQKVFAATEASVLSRNPNVDATTKDLLAYFQRCIQSKNPNINIGLMSV
jgi:hypothetical protein